jgi:iron complex transport system substrate-binding protein
VITNGAGHRHRAAATVAAAATLTLALALAACGGSDEDTAEAASSSTAGSDITVATAFGDVTVPAGAANVVTLAESALDVALGVGITPVGTVASRGGDAPPAYLGEDAASIPVVGTVREANLEAVLETEPDVILAASGLTQEQYDALTAIAPTVVPEAPAAGEWGEPLHVYAEALGADDELTERLDAVEERAQALAGDAALSGTAAVVRWMANGPVIMNSSNMPGMLLQAAGAEPVQAAVELGDSPHSDPLSLENLGEVDADRLFLAAFGADGASALDAAQTEPAFTRLKAAQSGATSSVDGGVWSSSSGPIAAEQVMDDIEAAVD